MISNRSANQPARLKSMKELRSAPGSGVLSRRRSAYLAFIASMLGLALAVVWSYRFVDDVIGDSVAVGLLGDESLDGPVGGASAGLLLAFVTGIAGTFTACNIACFGALGPLTDDDSTDDDSTATSESSLGWVLKRLGWFAAGMCSVAALYGAAAVLVAAYVPQLSNGMWGAMPVRLVQATVVYSVVGGCFVYLGLGSIGLASDPFARLGARSARARLIVMGGLVGLLLAGRPFPLFAKVFHYAAETHNPLYGAAALILVCVGNVVILAILFIALFAVTRGHIRGWSTAHPDRIAVISGLGLIGLGSFTVVYWGARLPAMFGYGWFPIMPWNAT